MIENFPHVVGKSDATMCEFTDGFGVRGLVLCGKEKFCIRRNFPGRSGFGIIARGEDWKGPSSATIVSSGKGPR